MFVVMTLVITIKNSKDVNKFETINLTSFILSGAKLFKELKYLLFLLLITSFDLFSQITQLGTLSGYVYDQENGETLIGANTYIKELKIGCSSNSSGYFVIPNIPYGEYTFVCSLIGYKSQTQTIIIKSNEQKFLKIKLISEAIRQKEVVITAEPASVIEKLFEKPVSKIELTPTQINRIPQVIESDLLRSLQTLPGIVSISDFSNALYIRGGTPDQNLFLLDGTDVYNPEHAFGLFSTFNTDAIKRVDISKGGFGAEYGGRLSSIINITNIDGNRNRFEGNVGISLLSAKTTLQTPLGDFGSLSGSFRRTYFDQTIAKWVEEVPDYYFYDGNLKTFLELDDKNKLTLSFYGGLDKLDYKFDKKSDESPSMVYDWGNQTGSINWKRIFNPELFGNFWLTYSRFASNFKFSEEDINEDNLISDFTFKSNIEYYYLDNLNFKFGFEYKNAYGYLKETFPGGRVDATKYRQLYVAYLTTHWNPSILWDVEAGIRFDYFVSDRNFQNIDPRLSVKYRLTETTNLKFATGIYHQYVEKVERGFIVGIWTTADKYVNGSKAYHYILGFQKEFAKEYQFEAEAYYKKYKDLYSYNYLTFVDVSADDYDEKGRPIYKEAKGLFNRGDGSTIGLEFLLRKDVGAVNGWIGYALTHTEFKIDGINQNKSFVPRHNRTSMINVVANVDIKDFFDEINGKERQDYSSRWLIGLNFVYSTGQPITVPGSVYSMNSLSHGGEDGFFIYPTDINAFTLPAYMRLDLSISYEKKYESWSLSPYLQVFNVSNRRNIWFINYDHETKDDVIIQKIETFPMMPILPSIGVNIKF
jgi:hypothetical protein